MVFLLKLYDSKLWCLSKSFQTFSRFFRYNFEGSEKGITFASEKNTLRN